MGSGPFWRPSARRPLGSRAVAGLLLGFVAVVLVLPVSPLSAASTAAPPPSGARSAEHPVTAPPRTAASRGGAALPGGSLAGERAIDASRLALAAGAPTPPLVRASPVPHPLVAPLTTPPTVTGALGGSISGLVFDYTYGTPLAGATVIAEPFGSTSCLPGLCTNTTTGSNGGFTLSTIVGAVSLLFTAPDYVGNQTWTDVGRGQSVDLGYVFLIHDGYVTGTVEAATPGQAPIPDIEVNATSRIGDLSGNPGAITGLSGTFDIPVPPVPSEISVTPLAGSSPYLPNETFVNVSSYGTLDVGVIHLEGGVALTAELIDRSTGRPIADGTPSQLTYCSRPADICTQPILNETGANVTAWGMPGAASVTAAAIGYLVNDTPVGVIPNSNGTVDLGPIYLVPMAAAEISTNFTGGTPPSHGWPAGNVTAYVCSLDSLDVAVQLVRGGELLPTACWPRGLPGAQVGNTFPVGTTALVVGPPMRDAIILVPANGSPPAFPIAEAPTLSPSPEYPASFANITWANLTPNTVTEIGAVDVAAGDYVSGNVTEAGLSGSLDGTFSVQVCSTDSAGDCGTTVLSSDLEPAVAGCPVGPADFCAPAPPGPDMITVTEIGPGTTNVSWLQVPAGCCAQSGAPISVGTIGLPPASAYGILEGIVDGRTGGWGTSANPPGYLYGVIEACPVGPGTPGVPTPSCTFGALNATSGAFSMVAPSGWDKVTASAAGYQQNWTWVFVNGTNFSGFIELTPNAYLTGTVDSGAGGPVSGAVISACPVGTPDVCTAFASTGTNGQYNGSLSGGAYPWATYAIQASYPGFVTDWTWINATAGAILKVPTLVLPVLSTPNATSGSNGTARPLWVTGTVIDNQTGLPVRLAVVGECEDLSCSSTNTIASYGGTFNLTWIAGEDQLIISSSGYVPRFVSVPPSSAASEALGDLLLTPEEWVSGQVDVGPWASLATSDGLGASVGVQFCPPPPGPPCGVASTTNTAGFYNTTSYPGPMALEAGGLGIDAFGSGQGGYTYLLDPETIPSGNFTTLSPVSVELFAGISGQVMDGTGSGGNASNGSSSGFVDVVARPPAVTFTPYQWSFVITGPSGRYTFFLAVPLNGSVNLTASAIGYRGLQFAAYATAPAPGIAPVPVGAMSHDGYLNATVVDAMTRVPIAFASVVASVADPSNGSAFSLGYYTNGSGEVNTTAPAGPAVTVVVSAPGYYSRTYTVVVTGGATTALGVVGLTEGAPPTGFFVQSEWVNTAGVPALPTAVDPKTGDPLPDAEIQVAVSNGTIAATTYTNDLGQFLLWVPTTPFIDLTLTLNAYDPVTIYYATAGVDHLVLRYVNTTGSGIVSGRVVVEPNGTGLYDTEVNVCPYGATVCLFQDEAVGFTNVSGEFWVPATRGFDTASVATEQYLANSTPSVSVVTEGFYDIGTIDVYAFATVSGVVLSIPGGQPVPGANVSLCSTFGTPYGPCDSTTVTGAAGNFSFTAPPSTYVLVATAPGFNETYRPILLGAGQELDVGAILLVADGVLTGTAVSSFSGAPIANATIIACLTDAPSDCTPFIEGNPDGTFVLEAPPGPVLLTVSAPEFISNYTSVTVPAGGFYALGKIALTPLAIDIPESLSGSVDAANRSDAPIAGAFVALTVGTIAVSSAVTGATGSFDLPAPWGTYTLVVSATGYLGVRLPLILHTNVTGYAVALATRTFLVTGAVRDASTGVALAGVGISEAGNGTVLATTTSAGSYRLYLPNGSYELEAQAATVSGVSYFSLSFPVDVDGATVVHNISLAESTARLTGLIVDASSGLPIPGASVKLSGGSLAVALEAVASVTGGFSFSVAPGSYLLNASATGYTSASIDVEVPTAGIVDVPLSASSVGGPGPGGISPLELGVAGVAAAAVVLGVVLVLRRRPPPPPELPKWTLDDLEG